MLLEEIVPCDLQFAREPDIVTPHPRDLVQKKNRLGASDAAIQFGKCLAPRLQHRNGTPAFPRKLLAKGFQLKDVRHARFGRDALQFQEHGLATPGELLDQSRLADSAAATTRDKRRNRLRPKRLQLPQVILSTDKHSRTPFSRQGKYTKTLTRRATPHRHEICNLHIS